VGLEAVRAILLPNAFHAEELWNWRARITPFTSYVLPWYPGTTFGASWHWTTTWDERKSDTGVPYAGNEGITHGYVSSVNWRSEWLPLVATDLSYQYGQQLQPMTVRGGVTSNRITTALSVGRYDRLAFRMATGYNFLPAPSELRSELQRYDPVSAELRMQSGRLEYRYAATYDVFRSAFTLVDQAVRAFMPSGVEGQVGVNFVRDAALNPINLDVYGSFVWPFQDVRLEGGFRYEFLNDYLKEQRYGVSWNFLDCWNVRASYVVRSHLVGASLSDQSFFWLDLRLTAFPSAVPLIPPPGALY